MNECFSKLDVDIISRFQRAIELGKWPDGRALTQEQKEMCMQAVIYWEHHYVPKQERTAYVPPKTTPCETKVPDTQEIKWT